MNKHALVIEHEACWGCRTCEAACMQGYHFKSRYLNVTEEGPTPGDGMLDYMYRVNVCQHCDDPPCVEACPEAAITKREDGIVILGGARPVWNHARTMPYATTRKRQGPQVQFLSLQGGQGLIPACADNMCLAHCIYFGDPLSSQKAIQEKRRRRQTR